MVTYKRVKNGKETTSAGQAVPLAEVYQIAYWSCSRISGDSHAVADAIRSLLVTSRRNNLEFGLTGVLLFGRGYFAQLLEGPRPGVELVLDRIKLDQRHRDIVMVHEQYVDPRDFAGWSMAFVSPAWPQDIVIEPPDAGPVSLNLSKEASARLEMLRYLVREPLLPRQAGPN